MKKISLCILTAFMLVSFIPIQLKAGAVPIPTAMDSARAAESIAANALILRLSEIKTLDKSKMSSMEKKQLRNEVKTIKSKLKNYTTGVYLSTGAIIIIVLLLILLL